jgi:hypothetical protein
MGVCGRIVTIIIIFFLAHLVISRRIIFLILSFPLISKPFAALSFLRSSKLVANLPLSQDFFAFISRLQHNYKSQKLANIFLNR